MASESAEWSQTEATEQTKLGGNLELELIRNAMCVKYSLSLIGKTADFKAWDNSKALHDADTII